MGLGESILCRAAPRVAALFLLNKYRAIRTVVFANNEVTKRISPRHPGSSAIRRNERKIAISKPMHISNSRKLDVNEVTSATKNKRR